MKKPKGPYSPSGPKRPRGRPKKQGGFDEPGVADAWTVNKERRYRAELVLDAKRAAARTGRFEIGLLAFELSENPTAMTPPNLKSPEDWRCYATQVRADAETLFRLAGGESSRAVNRFLGLTSARTRRRHKSGR